MKPADRLTNLPPYLFAELDRAKARVRAQGHDIIDLSIGDPELLPPPELKVYLTRALDVAQNHRYPPYAGSKEFRTAIASWMKRRHNAPVDIDREIVALIGSKEGIAHFVMATINPGDTVLVPSPGYPPYIHATILAGGKAEYFPLLPSNNFQPDFDAIPESTLKRAKIMFLNYPNNPTSAAAKYSTYERAVKLAQKYGFLIVSDSAYIDVSPPDERAISILSVPDAKSAAIEFHSLSKTFNIAGWRIGWCAGNEAAISILKRIKESLDSGTFTAIQNACAEGMMNLEGHVDALYSIYASRREHLSKQLSLMGLKVTPSRAGFYVWAKISEASSAAFCARLLEKCHVAATPGLGFGPDGEGYVRFSLTAPTERIIEATERMAKL